MAIKQQRRIIQASAGRRSGGGESWPAQCSANALSGINFNMITDKLTHGDVHWIQNYFFL